MNTNGRRAGEREKRELLTGDRQQIQRGSDWATRGGVLIVKKRVCGKPVPLDPRNAAYVEGVRLE